MPSESEQDHFRQLCQARFYEQDRDATLQIEALLKDASATAQSCYNKILSSVRQKYHEDVTRERQENLRRVLLEAMPDLDLDRDERRAKVKNFLESYASKELIGTHPFLKALYTVLYLQTVKDSKGGAGGKCIEWALQEEVFMEAGSGDWTKESVTLLKTVCIPNRKSLLSHPTEPIEPNLVKLADPGNDRREPARARREKSVLYKEE